MAGNLFVDSVQKIANKQMSVAELIGAAEALKVEGDPQKLIQIYQLWVQSNPNDAMLHVALFNLAVLQTDAGDLHGAKAALELAIQRSPDFYPPYVNLGTLLERMGTAGEAIQIWTAMVNRLGNVTTDALNYKLTGFKQIGRVLENNLLQPNAEHVLKQSLQHDASQPDVAQHYLALRLAQCEWPIVSSAEGLPQKKLMRGLGPLSASIYTDDPMLQLTSAWRYSRNSIGYPDLDLQEHHQHARTERRNDRLRIGYVSSDLRNHAVGFIMAEMFELHDRRNYEVFAYYCGIPQEDALKTRIRNSIEHWVDIRTMSDEEAAKRILDDKIDILIDVNGFTKDARTRVLAMRPAPIIVNWLGYPGSMASPYHHYIIADDWIIPEDSEHYYTEKVLRLPCYQPNDRKRQISANRPTRAQVGLPENAFVFCSFNGSQKISRFTFDRWMDILKAVPDSVLWLLESQETTNARLREAATARGVAPERIVFAGKVHNPDHLARYPLADLFLDTTPYGAHVTASDALWMGVPILTFAGRSFASRVCSGLVRAAGLPEMVCDSPEVFVTRAIELGRNRLQVTRLKEKLAANRDRCTLFDMNKLVRSLEGLFDDMWSEYRKGNLPRPDMSNFDLYHEIGCDEFDHDAVEMLTVKDYDALYREKIAKRHRYCAVPADDRLWTRDAIAKAEGGAARESSSSVIPLLKKKKR